MENGETSRKSSHSENSKRQSNILRYIFRVKQPKEKMTLNSYCNRRSPDSMAELRFPPPVASFIPCTKNYPAPPPPTIVADDKERLQMKFDRNDRKEHDIGVNCSNSLKNGQVDQTSIIKQRKKNVLNDLATQELKDSVGPIYDEIFRETNAVYASNVMIATGNLVQASDQLIADWRRTADRTADPRISAVQQHNLMLDLQHKSVSEATLTLSPESSDEESTRTTPLPPSAAASPMLGCHLRIRTDHFEPANRGHVDSLSIDRDGIVVKQNFKPNSMDRNVDRQSSPSRKSVKTLTLVPMSIKPAHSLSNPSSGFQSPTSINTGSSSSINERIKVNVHNNKASSVQSCSNGLSTYSTVETEYAKLMKMFTKWELMTTSSSTQTYDYADMQRSLIDQQKIVYDLWTVHMKHKASSPATKSVATTITDLDVSPESNTTKITQIAERKPTEQTQPESISSKPSDVIKFAVHNGHDNSQFKKQAQPTAIRPNKISNFAEPHSFFAELKSAKKIPSTTVSSNTISSTKTRIVSASAEPVGLTVELAETLKRRRQITEPSTATGDGEDVLPTLRRTKSPHEKCGVVLGRVVLMAGSALPPLPPHENLSASNRSEASNEHQNKMSIVNLEARDDLMAAIRATGGFRSLKRTAKIN